MAVLLALALMANTVIATGLPTASGAVGPSDEAVHRTGRQCISEFCHSGDGDDGGDDGDGDDDDW